jgi:hypothetical protein
MAAEAITDTTSAEVRMSDSPRADVSLIHRELEIVTAALTARFPTKVIEDRRIAHMHEMLATASGLGRALTAYTQHGLVHCRGTRGCTDLDADAIALFEALAAWCDSVREIAALYPLPYLGTPSHPKDVMPTNLEPRFDYAG